MAKDISDAELDKMIDQSVDSMKKENATDKKEEKKEQPLDEKKDRETKQDKKQPKEDARLKQTAQVEKQPKENKKNAKKEEKKAKEPAMKVVEGYDPWKILQYPHLAEKSMNMVEMENKLIFVVRREAKRIAIKEAVEKGFGVKVISVNVTITRKGYKKAYVKLAPEYSAADIATRLGMI